MPSRKYALVDEGPSRLELRWKWNWSNMIVLLDGQQIGGPFDKTDLERQAFVTLPDGAILGLLLDTSSRGADLHVNVDGKPLVGSAFHPRTQLRTAAAAVFFIAGVNILLGIGAMAFGWEPLIELGGGIFSIIYGALFLGLGLLVVLQRSRIALGIALVLFTVDSLLTLGMAFSAEGPPRLHGVIMRVIIFAMMWRGFGAISEMRERQTNDMRPSGARVIALVGMLFLASYAQAQNTVGEVSFANSGSEAAQPAFARGLALLHNFEYLTAAETFREAQKIDPDFAMAYWGEAMTHTHPIWFQQDAAAARAVLQRLGATPPERAAKAKTERERAYLQTVEILYGDGTKEERDFKFADAMAALHKKYPDDIDAAAFHALALLGTSHSGRDTATYMRAAAILEEVFPQHRDHPGVLHYLIHSYDDPVHAPLGMRAARLYGAVAPEAGHALHMTSHIFVAMGMWDDVIDANRRAIDVVNKQRTARGRSPMHCGHYPTWEHYALLQQHRTEEADKMRDACRADVLNADFRARGGMDTPQGRTNEYAQMVAARVMAGGAFPEADRIALPDEFSEARFTIAYAEAIDAYRRNDANALRAASMKLRTLDKADHAGMDMSMNMGGTANEAQRRQIVLQQVEALQLALGGKREDAIAMLRKAADAEAAMPYEFGPPAIQKPTHELLAEQLAAAKRPREAADAYRAALARTPGRVVVVEGLSRLNH